MQRLVVANEPVFLLNVNNPAYNEILNQASDLILKATGRWEKSFTYAFLNAGISSILSGWY